MAIWNIERVWWEYRYLLKAKTVLRNLRKESNNHLKSETIYGKLLKVREFEKPNLDTLSDLRHAYLDNK